MTHAAPSGIAAVTSGIGNAAERDKDMLHVRYSREVDDVLVRVIADATANDVTGPTGNPGAANPGQSIREFENNGMIPVCTAAATLDPVRACDRQINIKRIGGAMRFPGYDCVQRHRNRRAARALASSGDAPVVDVAEEVPCPAAQAGRDQ